MEISYLDFEVRNIKDISKVLKGKTIYDPTDRKLVFYGPEEELLFTKSLEAIMVIPHYLRDHKIAFKDEDGENLVTIQCNKKETLDIRSFRFLLNKIISINNRMLKKPDKSEAK